MEGRVLHVVVGVAAGAIGLHPVDAQAAEAGRDGHERRPATLHEASRHGRPQRGQPVVEPQRPGVVLPDVVHPQSVPAEDQPVGADEVPVALAERMGDPVGAKAPEEVEIDDHRHVEAAALREHELLAAASVAGHAGRAMQATRGRVDRIAGLLADHAHPAVGSRPGKQLPAGVVARVILVDDHPVVGKTTGEILEPADGRRQHGADVPCQPGDRDPRTGHGGVATPAGRVIRGCAVGRRGKGPFRKHGGREVGRWIGSGAGSGSGVCHRCGDPSAGMVGAAFPAEEYPPWGFQAAAKNGSRSARSAWWTAGSGGAPPDP